MEKSILEHYLRYSVFTNPGCYNEYLKNLPNDIEELGKLVCHQVIHRVTLKQGNTNANWDLKYGNMNDFPWHRLRCEDDVLTTTVSMVAELFRLDSRGFTKERKVENKIVVTCRYVAVLMASILKTKGIPCRVRSGFAPYFTEQSVDHWINQYWNKDKQKWIAFDADFFPYPGLDFDQFDIPNDKFDWSANTWIELRKGNLSPNNYFNAGGYTGLMPVMWELFYDFHCLMNNEILYLQAPKYVANFETLTEAELSEIDQLAFLLLDPEKTLMN